MSSDEWQACTDPQAMLLHLRGRAGDRELRLFACACCRRIWDYMPDASRKAVEVAERFANGEAPEADLARAEAGAWDAVNSLMDMLVVTPKEERRPIRVHVEASKAAAETAVCRMGRWPTDAPSVLEAGNAKAWSAAWVVSNIVTGAVRRARPDGDRSEIEAEERKRHADLLRKIVGQQ